MSEQTDITNAADGQSSLTDGLGRLLPCPFCGGKPFVDSSGEHTSDPKYCVCCDCGIATYWGSSEKEVTGVWNKRPNCEANRGGHDDE